MNRRLQTRRILVVGMADSVHLGRWLEQFVGTEFVFHIVSSSPHRGINTKISKLLAESGQFEMSFISRYLALPFWLLDRILGDRLRGLVIAIMAKRFKPDLVHVLEFQNGGYSYLRARRYSSKLRSVPLLLTPYGSDIFWFQRYKSHEAKIRALLSLAAALSSECERDEKLAVKYGFTGSLLPRIPAFGAINYSTNSISLNNRDVIAVKGYQNKWGQAANSLKALEKISFELRKFEIVIFSCNRATISIAKRFAKSTGLSVITHKKGALEHEEVQSILSRSLLYIGLSKSDGISASMIEAMANGAIPIQSSSSCCEEWLSDGQGGFLVRYDDINAVAQFALRVIRDDSFRKRAVQTNFKDLQAKLSTDSARNNALATYRELPAAQ